MQVRLYGDLVWKDNDGNGLQGGVGETGIPGVIVTLTYTINSTNFTVLDTTDANGIYTFNNLPPATYRLILAPPPGTVPLQPMPEAIAQTATPQIPMTAIQPVAM
ncbi:MAG: hypothetical protein IPF93_07120 [Saprospiraceae bacterium]|nr:hypothetical protein [Saprospiraceae bacterium]